MNNTGATRLEGSSDTLMAQGRASTDPGSGVMRLLFLAGALLVILVACDLALYL